MKRREFLKAALAAAAIPFVGKATLAQQYRDDPLMIVWGSRKIQVIDFPNYKFEWLQDTSIPLESENG